MAVYTHGHHDSVLRSHNTRTVANSAAYLEPLLSADAHLLDVGAGPGTITVDFASRVGRVTATEINADALSLSQTLAAERGATNIDFSVEDVHALSFADGSFDIVHAHQVLQHVGDPVQALREMRRVTRPGGPGAGRDADAARLLRVPLPPQPARWLRLYREAARANGGEPDAGRRLLAWARAAGFTDITATASTWCYATPAEREWWGGMWADRILESALARQLTASEMATDADLKRISDAWRAWAADGDGWYLVPHGEILARV